MKLTASMLLCVPLLATGANAMSAAECTFQHTTSTAEEGCVAIQTFALCLAQVRAEDPNLVSAEKLLGTAQEETKGCDIQVNPSFKVVNREVRRNHEPWLASRAIFFFLRIMKKRPFPSWVGMTDTNDI